MCLVTTGLLKVEAIPAQLLLDNPYQNVIISAILVSGGYNGDRLASVEALHPNGSHICNLPDLPTGRAGHTLDGLTSCGGYDGRRYIDTCVTLSSGQWTQSHQMIHARPGHTSWSTDNQVYLIGGIGSSETSEILTPGSDTTTKGFKLEYKTR